MEPAARVDLGVLAGRTVGRISRRLRLGAGASLPGRVCLTVAPASARALARGRRVVLVSGTNGKTTTTAMARAALRTEHATASNDTGANLRGGIVAALLDRQAAVAVLEVDELLLPWAIRELDPEVIALLNLSRDQLDRSHEVRAVAETWRRALADSASLVVANADDPLVAWSAEAARNVAWVGAGQTWRKDAASCMECGGDLGTAAQPWGCPRCRRHRPDLDYAVDGPDLRTARGERGELRSSLPGNANRANAAVAAAVAREMGVDLPSALRATHSVRTVAGRYDIVRTHEHEIRFLLAKNPAGWCEVLEMLDTTPRSTPVVVAVNARAEDGRDTSWLWDVEFEKLDGRFVISSGERATDLSARLRYADVGHLVEPDVRRAVHALGPGPVTTIANYSAFRQLRGHHAA